MEPADVLSTLAQALAPYLIESIRDAETSSGWVCARGQHEQLLRVEAIQDPDVLRSNAPHERPPRCKRRLHVRNTRQ
jgi:hypothetical protein